MIQLRSQRNQLLTLGLVLILFAVPFLPWPLNGWLLHWEARIAPKVPINQVKSIFFRMDLSPEQQAVISGGLN